MSIWISKRLVALILCLPLLAACEPDLAGTGTRPAGQVRVQPVLGGDLKVAAPTGYCIEPTAVLERRDTAIVLIGRCVAGGAGAPAILTATVGAEGTGVDIAANGNTFAQFFRSAQGRAALSRSGRAANVKVLDTVGTKTAFLVRLTDTSPNPYGPGQAESWRAVTSISGRLVTLTVTGTADAPLGAAAGKALVDRFVAAMLSANSARSG